MDKEHGSASLPGGHPEAAGHPPPTSPGELTPEKRQELIRSVAEMVVRRGMAVPAIFFLETCKPLSYVGSQVMVFFGPFVQALYPFHRYYDFVALMEDRENVERLLVEIERLEDEAKRREREEKARRKESRRQANGKRGRRRWFPAWFSTILLVTTHLMISSPGAQETAADTMALDTIPPAPVTDLSAIDTPNDHGHSITLSWSLSADDGYGADDVKGYRIYRSESPTGEFELVGTTNAGGDDGGRKSYTDATAEDGVDYYFRVGAYDGTMEAVTQTATAVQASGQWFNTGRINMLIAVLVLSIAILFYIRRAESGAKVYLRPVAGLKAFEEGVGRATEMGRKVLYVPGIMDLDQVETVAGVIILGYVARMTARYETPLEVPVSRSLVMATSREICRESYTSEGRPDLYDDEMIHYLTDDQFAYAAGVDGIMLREKPGTIFYQGKFYAESLILAETGNSIGAVQIAGTASPSQLPFFVTACDYTLIGEELFAASAYLSREAKLLGSIKGQDFGKVLFMGAIILGVLLETLGSVGLIPASWSITGWFNVQ